MTLLLVSRGILTVPPPEDGIALEIAARSDGLATSHVTGAPFPTLYFRVAKNGFITPEAQGLPDYQLTAITEQPSAISLFELNTPKLDVDILVIHTPWLHLPQWQNSLRQNRRSIILSTLGFHQDSWHDGPLAHITANGTVASYLPSGGPGALLVPLEVNPSHIGLPVEDIAQVEGAIDVKAHRCLLAATKQILTGCEDALTFVISEQDLRSAIALVLIRQAFPTPRVAVQFTSSPAPQWRRLLQNLNVHDDSRASTRHAPLPDLIPTSLVDALLRSVNSASDVVPIKLGKRFQE